jgi:hypothetical protein
MGSRVQPCTTFASEAAADAINALINKALRYPRKGTPVGAGPHVVMPDTWDGSGDCPPGWTAQAVSVAVGGTVELPLPATIVAELQLPASQARLTAAERTQVNNAIAARSTKDLAGYAQREVTIRPNQAQAEESKR